MQRTSRPPSKLSDSVHRQVSSYALAASAAGVGVLALVQAAEARIIYTPTHKKLPIGPLFHLDLNHDGISDFAFHARTSDFRQRDSAFLGVYGAAGGNSVVGRFESYCASALRAGVRVGPSNTSSWGRNRTLGAVSLGIYSKPVYWCPWAAGVKSVGYHYVGLKFVINGKTHFGWARLNVRIYRNPESALDAILTGYAYETIPNKATITGRTHGPDVVVKHATLGELAVGRK